MNKIEKWQLMQKIGRELEDISNSQTSVLKKIAQVEAENINLGNATLEKKLTEMYNKVSSNLELVTSTSENFNVEMNKFNIDNKIDELLDPTV